MSEEKGSTDNALPEDKTRNVSFGFNTILNLVNAKYVTGEMAGRFTFT